MRTVEPMQLSTLLDNYIRQNKMRRLKYSIAQEMNISYPTLCYFLKGNKKPHAETIEKVRSWMVNKNIITAGGHILDQQSEEEESLLKSIFTRVPVSEDIPAEPETVEVTNLDQWHQALAIAAVMGAMISNDEKRTIIAHLMR